MCVWKPNGQDNEVVSSPAGNLDDAGDGVARTTRAYRRRGTTPRGAEARRAVITTRPASGRTACDAREPLPRSTSAIGRDAPSMSSRTTARFEDQQLAGL